MAEFSVNEWEHYLLSDWILTHWPRILLCSTVSKESPHSFNDSFLRVHVCRKTLSLCRWGTKTVPLGEPNYGQPNSARRGTISAPFFLSEVDNIIAHWLTWNLVSSGPDGIDACCRRLLRCAANSFLRFARSRSRFLLRSHFWQQHKSQQIWNDKARFIYWGKFAQGLIQILPTWDTTWDVLSWNKLVDT